MVPEPDESTETVGKFRLRRRGYVVAVVLLAVGLAIFGLSRPAAPETGESTGSTKPVVQNLTGNAKKVYELGVLAQDLASLLSAILRSASTADSDPTNVISLTQHARDEVNKLPEVQASETI